jgi:hypothetical protein
MIMEFWDQPAEIRSSGPMSSIPTGFSPVGDLFRH